MLDPVFPIFLDTFSSHHFLYDFPQNKRGTVRGISLDKNRAVISNFPIVAAIPYDSLYNIVFIRSCGCSKIPLVKKQVYLSFLESITLH